MNRTQVWAFVAMILGILLAAVSVTADVLGGSDWWHLGTATGAGVFVYGFTVVRLDRRGHYLRR